MYAQEKVPQSYQSTQPSYAQPVSTDISFDKQYFLSLPGILQILEIIICLIAFSCFQSSALQPWSGIGYASFTVMFALLSTAIVFVIIVINFHQQMNFLNWPKIMFFFCLFHCIHVLIGGIIGASRHFSEGALVGATIFSFFGFLVYGFHAFVQFKSLRPNIDTTQIPEAEVSRQNY